MKQALAATELVVWLRAREDAMAALLRALAEEESPSTDPGAQAQAAAIVSECFAGLGFEVARVRDANGVEHLLAQPGDHADGEPYQLLLGHLDTVWPLGTLERMPVREASGQLAGPGVYDMKGGLVQMIFALRALAAHGVRPELAPVVFVNGDEEIGSRGSRAQIERLAAGAARAYVLEPSFGRQGALKTTRKGVGRFTLRIIGRASHAGLNPEGGASAILEATHQIQRLFELNDRERGITVNVGTIDGGLRPNVIAPEVTAVIDARVPTAQDAERIAAAIHGLEPVGEHIQIEVTGGFGRPPLEPTPRNRQLWDAARMAGEELGMELSEAAVGGGSDGNLTSLHTATLDGLGPVGGGAHAETEHVLMSAMPERAALLALLLMLPAPEA